jgi:transposase
VVDYLSGKGYRVLLVNPLTTYYSRPLMNNDFSKTDPKDALLVATNAHSGNYNKYIRFSPAINRLHRLSITYDKLIKDRQRVILRMRAFMDEVFPEYLKCVNVEIESSLYLLERYFLPEHFRGLDIDEHEWTIRRISNGNHKADMLKKVKEHAHRSVGRNVEGEQQSLRLILDVWISEMRQMNEGIKALKKAMVELAEQTEYFEILKSVPGISGLTAARFIAECRDLDLFSHYRQIEKMAGSNLKVADSGKFTGIRRISGIGNKRLLKLIYLMTTQTARFTPEVRIKFIRRQLKKGSYRKNIMASSSVLLKLLMSLVKNKRNYELKEETLKELERLELKYDLGTSRVRPDKNRKKKDGKGNKDKKTPDKEAA